MLVVGLLAAAVGACGPEPSAEAEFSGERAFRLVAEQMEFGPRYPGSAGHAAVQSWIEGQLREQGWDWILGSSYYAANMDVMPDAVVIVDMIGDADLQLPKERNSTAELVDELWGVGRELGYDAFVDRQGYSIIDDHTPFLRRNVPAVDIIDFDYPYWHTEEDTLDKISAGSLMAVGHTVETWLEDECRPTSSR